MWASVLPSAWLQPWVRGAISVKNRMKSRLTSGRDVEHLFAAGGVKFQSLHAHSFLQGLLTMIQVWISWFSSVQCCLYSMRGPVTGPMS